MDWENEFEMREERSLASGEEERLAGEHERLRAQDPVTTTPEDVEGNEKRDPTGTTGFGGARDKIKKPVGATVGATAQTNRVNGERKSKEDSRQENSPRGVQGKQQRAGHAKQIQQQRPPVGKTHAPAAAARWQYYCQLDAGGDLGGACRTGRLSSIPGNGIPG